MQLNNSVSSLLGLAARARKIASGSLVLANIRSQKAKLVLIATDASATTRKQLSDKCAFYQVDYILVDDSEQLSKAIGKSNRKYLAILDLGFAEKIKEKLG